MTAIPESVVTTRTKKVYDRRHGDTGELTSLWEYQTVKDDVLFMHNIAATQEVIKQVRDIQLSKEADKVKRSKLEAGFEGLQRAVSKFRESLTLMTTDVRRIETRTGHHSRQIRAGEEAGQSTNRSVDELRTSVAEVEAAQGWHRERMANMEVRTETDIPNVLKRAGDLEAQFKVVEKTITDMYADHKSSQKAVTVNTDRIAGIQTTLQGLQGGLDTLRADLTAEERRALAADVATRDALRGEIRTVEGALRGLVREEGARLDAAREARRNETKADLLVRDKAVNELRAELVESAAVATAATEAARLEGSEARAQLSQSIEAAQAALVDYRSEVNASRQELEVMAAKRGEWENERRTQEADADLKALERLEVEATNMRQLEDHKVERQRELQVEAAATRLNHTSEEDTKERARTEAKVQLEADADATREGTRRATELQLIERKEEADLKTVAAERDTKVSQTRVEVAGRIRQERENEDVTMRSLALKGIEERKKVQQVVETAFRLAGAAVLDFLGDLQMILTAVLTLTAVAGGVYLAREVARVVAKRLLEWLSRPPPLVRETSRATFLVSDE